MNETEELKKIMQELNDSHNESLRAIRDSIGSINQMKEMTMNVLAGERNREDEHLQEFEREAIKTMGILKNAEQAIHGAKLLSDRFNANQDN